MTSARDLIAAAAQTLKSAGIDNPRLDARLLWEHALGVNAVAVLSMMDPPLEGGSKCEALRGGVIIGTSQHDPSPKNPSRSFAVAQEPQSFSTLPQGEGKDRLSYFESLIARRAAREPLAYIIGRKEFWSLSFAVGPGVLVPRPETETLIEEALRRFPDKHSPLRILDLGTGSGCVLLTLLREFPHASGMGVDVSEAALKWARGNAETLGVASRCRLVNSDWNVIAETGFDLIVSNPPYIAREEITDLSTDIAQYEPHTALDGGSDGLDAYRSLAGCVHRFITPEGIILMEIGSRQAESVSLLLQGAGLAVDNPVDDLAGIARCIAAGLNISESRKGSLRKRLETTR